jgi:opacity protein-like surface antigen
MKNLFCATAAALLLSTASHSFAEGGYLGGQYAQTTYEQSSTIANDADGKPAALIFVGGYNFNEHFAVEGRLGSGIGGDQFGNGLDIEVEYIISALGKLSLGGTVSPYILAGFTEASIESESGVVVDVDGTTIGLGVDFNVSENLSLGLEYVQYATVDLIGGGEGELSAIALGLNYKF